MWDYIYVSDILQLLFYVILGGAAAATIISLRRTINKFKDNA